MLDFRKHTGMRPSESKVLHCQLSHRPEQDTSEPLPRACLQGARGRLRDRESNRGTTQITDGSARVIYLIFRTIQAGNSRAQNRGDREIYTDHLARSVTHDHALDMGA
jgi:hypothetical protein